MVGVVALPLCIALAIASGLPPSYGLYTGIVGGFVMAALGGSRVQVGGPTGAFVVIVFGIVQAHGPGGLAVATVMAGGLLILLGLARLGRVIEFIPYPVTRGFTSGIGVVIFTTQVGDLLGLRLAEAPAEFFPRWAAYAGAAAALNPGAVGVAAVTFALIALWPRVSRKVPGMLVALVACTAAAALLDLEVETIGSRFGPISASLPSFSLPPITPGLVADLVAPAFTIAMLGGIESLLSAVVADGMVGSRHNSDMELIATGAANIAAPLLGGMPATGAIARTATNVRNGGRTPVAGIAHALTLLAITLFLGRWVAYVPLACLAAILTVVAYHMTEWRAFRAEFSAPRSDVLVLLVTFGLTVLVDLTVAIQVGLVLASFLFMRRMSEVTNVAAVTGEPEPADFRLETDPNAVRRRSIPAGALVYEISGPFFFGAAERFKEALRAIASPPAVLILRMRNVLAIDSTGLNALREVVRRTKGEGTLLLIADIHAQPLVALGRSDLLDEIGEENLYGNLDDALNRARRQLGLPEEPPPEGTVPTVRRERSAP